jgi:putative spermidine/putrescine transport system permease protein
MSTTETERPVATVATARPAQLRRANRRKQAVFRWVIVVIVMAFFLIPIIALWDFSTRLRNGTRNWVSWEPIWGIVGSDDDVSTELRAGLLNSVWLVLLTIAIMLVLLIPAMTWVRLRLPRLRRVMEFISLLPLTIPAVVLVVGLAPIYRVISNVLSVNSIWLCFVYAILVMPFAYRSLDAGLDGIDVKTLSEAARSLGSSWGGVIWRVVLPNIRTAVVSACFISLALVMGEFTVASLLARKNFQTSIFLVGQADAKTAAALALVALLLVFVLLFVLSFFGSGRTRKGKG